MKLIIISMVISNLNQRLIIINKLVFLNLHSNSKIKKSYNNWIIILIIIICDNNEDINIDNLK